MPATLSGITPTYASSTGGDLVTLHGAFDPSVTYAVSMGGKPCVSGIPGQATSITSLDGTSLAVFTPPLTGGVSYDVSVTAADGTAASLTAALQSRPPFYSSETFSLRSILPSIYNVGARDFSDLPAVAS